MLPVLAGTMLVTSCEKEVVEITPFDRLTEETAFDTPSRAELAIVGVYDAAQSGFYLGTTQALIVSRGYPFGAASIEQADVRGEDMLNLQAFYQISYENLYNATTANNQYMWETLYALINKANVVMLGAQTAATKGTIDAAKAKEYEAECRFLRALAHHELLVHFARPYAHTADASHLGVPYRVTAVNTPERADELKTQPRGTVKENYDKLLEDLNFAEENLPVTRIAAAQKLSRATKGAAIALKTRVLLHRGDYAGVIAEANKLVPAVAPYTSPIGGYTLAPTPDVPFTAAGNKSNPESIFSIENSATDNAGTNGALPQMYNPGGRALVAISPIIFNATFWPANDTRRTSLTAAGPNGRYFTTKYKDFATFSDNAPIIRYAEVILNLSEALARTSPLSLQALDLLNSVRGRATAPYSITTILSNDDLIQAIVNERRIEFLGEGRRWPDIHRLAVEGKYVYKGIPAKFTAAAVGTDYAAASGIVRPAGLTVMAIPYDDFRFIWPIPISEINANPTLAAQQNPGY